MINRRIVTRGLVALFIILAGVWAYNYFVFGNVEVTNQSGDIILSNPTSNGVSGSLIAHGTSRLSMKLKRGDYVISSGNTSTAVRQTIHIKSHTKSVYDITPRASTSFEPVLAEAASGIAEGARLAYLSPVNSKLYQIDSGNNLSLIAPNTSFRSVKWADSSYGVAQDNAGGLYIVDGSSVHPLNLPSEIQQKQYLQYAVTKNRDIYVAKGTDLYLGSEKTGLKKIESGLNPASLLVAGKQALAWIDDGDSSQGDEGGPNITVINSGNKITRTKIGSFVGAWSENDSYLAISSQNGGEILDKRLEHVASIPQSSFKNPAWLSDTRLAYSDGGQLWVFDTASGRSDLAGAANAGETITEITPSRDGAYIYMVVQGVNGNTSVRRAALNGSRVSPTLTKLTVFLPLDLAECTAEYINFTQLGVLVKVFSPSQVSQCINDVRSNLASDQIDTGALTFSVAPSPS